NVLAAGDIWDERSCPGAPPTISIKAPTSGAEAQTIGTFSNQDETPDLLLLLASSLVCAWCGKCKTGPEFSFEKKVEHVATEQNEKRSNTDIIIRAKRTKNSVNQSKRAGCSFLPTCTVHNLAHRIHQFSNKIDNAPPDKISPIGYGRRRRSLPEHMSVLLLEHGRLRLVKGEEARMARRKSQVFNRRT
ncbi:hypothetical protein JZ751_020794, partial [Albula glossodonta]